MEQGQEDFSVRHISYGGTERADRLGKDGFEVARDLYFVNESRVETSSFPTLNGRHAAYMNSRA